MTKTILEKAEELGLKKENIQAGLKSNKEGTIEAVEKAYTFMNKRRKK